MLWSWSDDCINLSRTRVMGIQMYDERRWRTIRERWKDDVYSKTDEFEVFEIWDSDVKIDKLVDSQSAIVFHSCWYIFIPNEICRRLNCFSFLEDGRGRFVSDRSLVRLCRFQLFVEFSLCISFVWIFVALICCDTDLWLGLWRYCLICWLDDRTIFLDEVDFVGLDRIWRWIRLLDRVEWAIVN